MCARAHLLLLGACLLVACASPLPHPIAANVAAAGVRWPGITLTDLERGRALYVRKCAGCHNLHLPGENTEAQWRRVFAMMAARAKLEPGPRQTILRYLLSFASPATEDGALASGSGPPPQQTD